MNGVTITKKVTLHMTAEDWELYCHVPGAHDAALHINRAIEAAFNEGVSQKELLAAALAEMRKHRNLGAMDSEPIYHLDKLVEKLYQK